MNTYLSDEQRNNTINEIINFFATEHDQEIGIIRAGEILDFFLETIGSDIYNQGITDIKKIIDDAFTNVSFETEMLKRK